MSGFKAREKSDFISIAELFSKYHDDSNIEICM